MTAPPSLLAEVMPRFDAREAHDVWIPASPAAAYAAVRAVTVREVRLLRPLLGLRRLPRLVARGEGFRLAPSEPALDAFVGAGFVLLGERPGAEVVAGIVSRFWRLAGNQPVPLRTREEFGAFAEPGYAKAAIAFAVRPEGGGSRVVTETRIAGTSPGATRAFARYWRVVRPGSAAIRRSWLAAIRRRAVAAARA